MAEVKARDAMTIAIATEGNAAIADVSRALCSSVQRNTVVDFGDDSVELLSYHVADARGQIMIAAEPREECDC